MLALVPPALPGTPTRLAPPVGLALPAAARVVANLPLALVNTPVNALLGAFVGLAAAVVPLFSKPRSILNEQHWLPEQSAPPQVCFSPYLSPDLCKHEQLLSQPKNQEKSEIQNEKDQNHRKYYLLFYA